jgi:hypothetical protein
MVRNHNQRFPIQRALYYLFHRSLSKELEFLRDPDLAAQLSSLLLKENQNQLPAQYRVKSFQ